MNIMMIKLKKFIIVDGSPSKMVTLLRWNVEVFFKIIKYNFKFSNMSFTNIESNNEIYSIHNIKILIVYFVIVLYL